MKSWNSKREERIVQFPFCDDNTRLHHSSHVWFSERTHLRELSRFYDDSEAHQRNSSPTPNPLIAKPISYTRSSINILSSTGTNTLKPSLRPVSCPPIFSTVSSLVIRSPNRDEILEKLRTKKGQSGSVETLDKVFLSSSWVVVLNLSSFLSWNFTQKIPFLPMKT